MWLSSVNSQVLPKSHYWLYQASGTWASACGRNCFSSTAETGLWTNIYYLPEVTLSPATHCLILLTAEPYYRGRGNLSCLEMSGQGLGNLFKWFYIHAQSILQASRPLPALAWSRDIFLVAFFFLVEIFFEAWNMKYMIYCLSNRFHLSVCSQGKDLKSTPTLKMWSIHMKVEGQNGHSSGC